MISLKRAYGFAVTALVSVAILIPGLAKAQDAGLSPPSVAARDANGVDLISGSFSASPPSMSIGTNGSGLTRSMSGYNLPWGDNFTATLNFGSDTIGSYITVSIGSGSEKFYGPASVTSSSTPVIYTPEIVGNTFVCVSYICTYTMSDGSVAVFDQNLTSDVGLRARLGAMTSLTKPDGEVLTLKYKRANTGTVVPGYGTLMVMGLRSVTSSLGWMIKYEVGTATTATIPVKIYLLSTYYDYCAPDTDGPCTSANSGTWPMVTPGSWTYRLNSTTQPDPSYTVSTSSYGSPISTNFLSGITTPTGVSISATYSSGKVTSLTTGGQTWNYTIGTASGVTTGTAVSAADTSVTRQVKSDATTSQILSVKDELGALTSIPITRRRMRRPAS